MKSTRYSARHRPEPRQPTIDSPDPSAPRLVLGLQSVRAAIRRHGRALAAVWLESDDNPRLQAVQRFASDHGVPRIEVVGRDQLARLSGGVLHQGVAAFAPELAFQAFEPLLEEPSLLGIALDRIQDPQNFGAVVRSAVGLNASCVIWGEHSSAPLGTTTARASAGAVEFARLCRVPSLPRALTDAAQAGIQIVGLDAQAKSALHEVDLRRPSVLVIGSEHDGMTPAVRRACTTLARLAGPSAVESLNASVAAAIALYECSRQRTGQSSV
ncbi:MAG TPA: RNA methyltransferase [Polyangiaceae bacterium]|nr:RNA methyltransferase [Polyangiaceae bacterium]